MAAVYGCEARGVTLKRCQEELEKYFQIDAEQSEVMLAEMAEGVEEAAAALGLRIKKQIPLNEVMQQANERLADEALSYQELTWRLERALQERDRLARQLNQELELAREIQQSLLPNNSGHSFPIHGLNISARAVSGDFYDFFPLGDGRIFFNLADVSGKGMNAALLMARTCSLFHCLGKTEHDIAKLMALVNEELCESPSRGMFVTMIGGLLDPRTGQIELINAGHPPALWVPPSGKIEEFCAQGPPLGVLSEAAYETARLTLNGGTLFMFSDGLSECEVKDAARLGIEGVKRLLTMLRNVPCEERLRRIAEVARTAGQTLRDDLTLLAIEG
jgi:sigma-B regulation protein RsbU (phosphoserine phosphatase)